jgi:pimeloyl-ACP methyl ester carboxylesterase
MSTTVAAQATVTSADGTVISYERAGEGPALILVDGAMCFRAAGPMRPLAALLTGKFTVYSYDRRGRGESTDTPSYAPAREVEDLAALIAEAGGSACLYAMSSGGALALATASASAGVKGLALYEPPYLSEVQGPARSKEYGERLTEALAEGRNGDAVELFLTLVGVPAPGIAHMRGQPGWSTLEGIAPTLGYDNELLGDGYAPKDLRIPAPILVMHGGATTETLRGAAEATAAAFPGAQHLTIEGQTHDVAPDVLAPVLARFFLG